MSLIIDCRQIHAWFAKKLAAVRALVFPSLARTGSMKAEWGRLFEAWLLEQDPHLPGAQWLNPSETIFAPSSPFTIDVIQSQTFSEVKEAFHNAGAHRSNPFPIEWKRNGKEPLGTLVDAFLGHWHGKIHWKPLGNSRIAISCDLRHTATWAVPPRLPNTWLSLLRERAWGSLPVALPAAPRGTVTTHFLRRMLREAGNRLPPLDAADWGPFLGKAFDPRSTAQLDGLPPLPSLGGDWRQTFQIRTTWTA